MSEWLEAGVIRRSSAGFNNTIILAKTKKVIDAGYLNGFQNERERIRTMARQLIN